MRRPLADEHVRALIAGAGAGLEDNLFVEAGAGTGKTGSLVERCASLVRRHGPASLHRLAAVTFTEAAAAELRERVREALRHAHRASSTDASRRHEGLAARTDASGSDEDLSAQADEAFIGTIHGFARSLLSERSMSVGVPPGFEVLDEIASRLDFDERWQRCVAELLADPDARSSLGRAGALGVRMDHLHEVARLLHERWHHLKEPRLRASIGRGRLTRDQWPNVDVQPLRRALSSAVSGADTCDNDDDKLLAHVRTVIAPALRSLDEALGQEALDHVERSGDDAALDGVSREDRQIDLLAMLAAMPRLTCTAGLAANWQGPTVVEERRRCQACQDALNEVLRPVRSLLLQDILSRLVDLVLQASSERRHAGRIGFYDLLALTAELLEHPDDRAALQQRWRWVLVDEYQDTDPLQTEILTKLGGQPLRGGSLFVVGDPKQSIYRFRAADIEQYRALQGIIGDPHRLICNFRSVPEITRWLNAVFGELFSGAGSGQAPHHDLEHTRPSLADGSGPPVLLFGRSSTVPADERREEESREVATAIRRVVGKLDGAPWSVAASRGPEQGPGCLTPARWRDVAILLPTRTGLRCLEAHLEDAAIPYRLEGAGLLWSSADVSDVLAVLRAAETPGDEVAVLAALRTPLMGCGDDDLVAFHRRVACWDPLELVENPVDVSPEHPALQAMHRLARYHRWRWLAEPSLLVEIIMSDCRAFELATAHARPRDHWHRLRWLLDQARAFDEEVGGSLHAFLEWSDAQARQGAPSAVGPPEPDDDAVRVMTVHGAKGLEFPVVVVMGLGSQLNGSSRLVWRDGVPYVRLGPQALEIASIGFEEASRHDQERDDQERVRLLYVATTRARDHLLISLHRPEDRETLASRLAASAERSPDLATWLDRVEPAPCVEPAVPGEAAGRGGEPDPQPGALDAWREQLAAITERWQQLRDAACWKPVIPAIEARAVVAERQLAEPRSALGAERPEEAGLARPKLAVLSSIEHGDRLAEPRGQPGVAAIRRGRALHDVLAAIDLADGAGSIDPALESVVHRCSLAHGVGDPEERAEVRRMACNALTGELAPLLANRRHWKEVYVAAPLVAAPLEETRPREEGAPPGGWRPRWAVEGFVDLLIEDGDAYVVIDYKTDAEQDPERAAERHRHQLACYALAVEAATGRTVRRACVYLLAGPRGQLVDIPALEDAIEEVRSTGAQP